MKNCIICQKPTDGAKCCSEECERKLEWYKRMLGVSSEKPAIKDLSEGEMLELKQEQLELRW